MPLVLSLLTRFFICSLSTFSVGDNPRDLGSVVSGWGPLRVCKAFPKLLPSTVRCSHLKMPRSAVLQDGCFTIRLAIACALRGIRVLLTQRFLWWWVRPALELGCQPSRGPLGLARGFYHARVRRLDVAHFDGKYGLGASKYAGPLSGHAPPAFSGSLATHSGGFGRAGRCAASYHSASASLGFKSHSGMSGSGNTGDQEPRIYVRTGTLVNDRPPHLKHAD